MTMNLCVAYPACGLEQLWRALGSLASGRGRAGVCNVHESIDGRRGHIFDEFVMDLAPSWSFERAKRRDDGM